MIPWTLIAKIAALLAAIGIGYGIVQSYNGALERAQEAETQRDAALAAVSERDEALSAWGEREREWKEARERDAAALLAKTKESEARQRDLDRLQKDYRHAISILPQAERDCAAMPVPAAVDRLLGQ